MEEQQLEKVKREISEYLAIKHLKMLVVRSQMYELAAQLRELEKGSMVFEYFLSFMDSTEEKKYESSIKKEYGKPSNPYYANYLIEYVDSKLERYKTDPDFEKEYIKLIAIRRESSIDLIIGND